MTAPALALVDLTSRMLNNFTMLSLLFVAQALTMSPPAKPPGSHPKVLFSYEDYPAEAVRNHWQGTVIADLTVSAAGRVTACKIVKSSGHAVLDDATCNIIIQRATFNPARDANGKPIEDHVQTPPIAWILRS